MCFFAFRISGGELFHLIASKGNLAEKTAKLFFHQILLAVEYLHENNVIHRDLKVCVFLSGDEPPCFKVFFPPPLLK